LGKSVVPEKIIAKYRIMAATTPAGKNKPAILAHGGFSVSSRSSGDRFFELRSDHALDLVACHHAPQHPLSALIQRAFFNTATYRQVIFIMPTTQQSILASQPSNA